MRKLHLLLLFAMVAIQAAAAPRSLRQAKVLAEHHAATHGVIIPLQGITPSRAFPQQQTDAMPYYVFNNGEDNGFTIVSGDDELPDIVGYSLQGSLTEGNIPVQLKDFLNAYSAIAKDYAAGKTYALKAVGEQKAMRETATFITVEPLLGTTRWNQGEPFNDLCPVYNETETTPTGCVATAMAQIMYMYKYPAMLQEDIPAYTTSSLKIEIPAVAKGVTYDYDLMMPYYGSAYSEESGAAVATLMSHCGRSVKMDYYPAGSGAGITVAADAFVKYFGYDKDLVAYVEPDNYTINEWNTLLQNELNAGRPVLYGGMDIAAGGHAFVCDGIDNNGFYHINWGWGGYANGYFDITLLNSNNPESVTAPDGFNRRVEILVGLAPDNGKTDEALTKKSTLTYVTNYDITTATRASAAEPFTVSLKSIVNNITTEDFSGYLNFKVVDNDGKELFVTKATKVNLPKRKGEVYYYFTLSEDISLAFPVGVSHIILQTSPDGINFEPLSSVSTNDRLTLVATETELKADVLYGVSGTLESVNEVVLAGVDNKMNLTVKNNNDNLDFVSDFLIYVSDTEEKPEQASSALRITLAPKAECVRNITVHPNVSGKVYVWVDHSSGASLINGKAFDVTALEGEPHFVLTAVTTNIKPDLYETQNAIFQGRIVRSPATDEGKAVVTYTVKNTGSMAMASFIINAIGRGENVKSVVTYFDDVLLDTNEECTFTETFTEEDVNSKFMGIQFLLRNSEYKLNIDESLEISKLFILDEEGQMTGQYYAFAPNIIHIYLKDTSTAVEDIKAGKGMTAGKGYVALTTDVSKSINIVNVSGQVVKRVNAKAGENTVVTLPAGVYIIEGRSVVVQ